MKPITGSRRRRPRRAGRPHLQAEEDVRQALIDAARSLFLERGFERTTARQIAAAAHTTPAMINYYFTDKAGLFQTMLEQTIAPLRELLTRNVGSDAGKMDPATLMTMQMRLVAANPWIASIVLHEVLAQPGRLRPMFIRDVAGRHMPLLANLMEQGKRSGQFRADLNAQFAALSFISLCIFPFLARAVVEPVFGMQLDAQNVDAYIEHTTRLLLRGIAAAPGR